MDTEKQKDLALQACINLSVDYTEEEVNKFFPVAVQDAWKIGREYLTYEMKESKKNRKRFTL